MQQLTAFLLLSAFFAVGFSAPALQLDERENNWARKKMAAIEQEGIGKQIFSTLLRVVLDQLQNSNGPRAPTQEVLEQMTFPRNDKAKSSSSFGAQLPLGAGMQQGGARSDVGANGQLFRTLLTLFNTAVNPNRD